MKSLGLFVALQAALLCKVWASIDNDRSSAALLVASTSSTTTPDQRITASDTKTLEEGKAELPISQTSARVTFLIVEIDNETPGEKFRVLGNENRNNQTDF